MESLIHHEARQNRGRTYELWRKCPREQIKSDWNIGTYISEDFVNGGKFATANAMAGWSTYQDTGDTIQMLATEQFGVMRLATAATDNNGPVLTTGGNVGGVFAPSRTAGSIHKWWFETRVRFGEITDRAAFIGLAEAGLAADNGLLADNSGDLADKDLVGFHVDTAGPAALDAVYRLAGGSAVVHKAAAATLVANTWYKLGMTDDGKHVRFYVDGVIVGDALSPGATFPLDQILALYFALKTGEGVAKELDCDWVDLFVEYGGT